MSHHGRPRKRKRIGFDPFALLVDQNACVDPGFDDPDPWLDEARHEIAAHGAVGPEQVFLDHDFHEGAAASLARAAPGRAYGPPKPLLYVPIHIPTPEEERAVKERREAQARWRQREKEEREARWAREREADRRTQEHLDLVRQMHEARAEARRNPPGPPVGRFEIEPSYDPAQARHIVARMTEIALADRPEMFMHDFPAWDLWACLRPGCNYRGALLAAATRTICPQCAASMLRVARYLRKETVQ